MINAELLEIIRSLSTRLEQLELLAKRVKAGPQDDNIKPARKHLIIDTYGGSGGAGVP